MLSRPHYLQSLATAMDRSPIVAILGPRQVGKTTLARLFVQDRQATYFDMESQPDIRRLQNPELALGTLGGIVVIDEIQAMPELFAVLRVLVDRPNNEVRFLILGSASPDIIKKRFANACRAGRVYRACRLRSGGGWSNALGNALGARWFSPRLSCWLG